MRFRMTDDIRKLQTWIDRHPEGLTSVQEIATDINTTTHAVVKSFKYITRKFLDFYDEQEAAGRLQGSPTQMWMVAIVNFKANYGVDPFIYDHEDRQYVEAPDFIRYQRTGAQRVDHWIRSGQTVTRELHRVHAEFLKSGKKPDELLNDLKLLEEKITDGPEVPRCPTCGDNIEPNWLACPTCGQPLTEGT